MSDVATTTAVVLLVVLGLFLAARIWFIPIGFAVKNNHPHKNPIIALCCCGLIFPIAWIAALAWSLMDMRGSYKKAEKVERDEPWPNEDWQSQSVQSTYQERSA